MIQRAKSTAGKKAGAGRKGDGRSRTAAAGPASGHRWTFLSNHAHVLISLVQDPNARLRDVAERIGITERAVQKIVADLEAEGLVERHREGRRNTYVLHLDQPLRHPIEQHRDVGELVDLIVHD